MFLKDHYVENTYMKELVGIDGHKETVLVVQMDCMPELIKLDDPVHYKYVSENISYLNNLADQGVLDFDRVEIVTSDRMA